MPDVKFGSSRGLDEFHDREPSHQEWKQAVLAGDIELDELDVETFTTPRRKL
jgi:hypothetical protein